MLNKQDAKWIFADALIVLAKKKPIEKISVSSIVDYCGAGRQTFYNHFKDKYELINWFYVVNANDIIRSNINTRPWGTVIGLTLSFVYKYKFFFGNAIK